MVKESLPSIADCAPCGLASYLNVLGGISVEQALLQADANLQEMRGEALNLIDRSLLRLNVFHDYAACSPTENVRRAMRDEANNIVGLAGVFGLGALGVAARLLCDFIDLMSQTQDWDSAGILLHHDAMRCLRTVNGGEDCKRALSGLQAFSLHVAARRAQAALLETISPSPNPPALRQLRLGIRT